MSDQNRKRSKLWNFFTEYDLNKGTFNLEQLFITSIHALCLYKKSSAKYYQISDYQITVINCFLISMRFSIFTAMQIQSQSKYSIAIHNFSIVNHSLQVILHFNHIINEWQAYKSWLIQVQVIGKIRSFWTNSSQIHP